MDVHRVLGRKYTVLVLTSCVDQFKFIILAIDTRGLCKSCNKKKKDVFVYEKFTNIVKIIHHCPIKKKTNLALFESFYFQNFSKLHENLEIATFLNGCWKMEEYYDFGMNKAGLRD